MRKTLPIGVMDRRMVQRYLRACADAAETAYDEGNGEVRLEAAELLLAAAGLVAAFGTDGFEVTDED